MSLLEEFLKVAASSIEEQQAEAAMVAQVRSLPTEALSKLAFCGDDGEWLDKFKGTPLESESLQIERRKLELDVAREQENAQDDQVDEVRSAQRQARNKAHDALRLQRTMLELKLRDLQLSTAEQQVSQPTSEESQPVVPVTSEEPAPAQAAVEEQPPATAAPAKKPPGGKSSSDSRKTAADASLSRKEVASRVALDGVRMGAPIGAAAGGLLGALRATSGTGLEGIVNGALTGAVVGGGIGGLGGYATGLAYGGPERSTKTAALALPPGAKNVMEHGGGRTLRDMVSSFKGSAKDVALKAKKSGMNPAAIAAIGAALGGSAITVGGAMLGRKKKPEKDAVSAPEKTAAANPAARSKNILGRAYQLLSGSRVGAIADRLHSLNMRGSAAASSYNKAADLIRQVRAAERGERVSHNLSNAMVDKAGRFLKSMQHVRKAGNKIQGIGRDEASKVDLARQLAVGVGLPATALGIRVAASAAFPAKTKAKRSKRVSAPEAASESKETATKEASWGAIGAGLASGANALRQGLGGARNLATQGTKLMTTSPNTLSTAGNIAGSGLRQAGSWIAKNPGTAAAVGGAVAAPAVAGLGAGYAMGSRR